MPTKPTSSPDKHKARATSARASTAKTKTSNGAARGKAPSTGKTKAKAPSTAKTKTATGAKASAGTTRAKASAGGAGAKASAGGARAKQKPARAARPDAGGRTRATSGARRKQPARARSPFGELRRAFHEAAERGQLSSPQLDRHTVLSPEREGQRYHCTPEGSEIFASLGVDGIHLAALAIDGVVSDASPVVQVSPMDAENNLVIAASLPDFLATGCGTTEAEIRQRQQDSVGLAVFVATSFKLARLTTKARTRKLWREFSALIVLPP